MFYPVALRILRDGCTGAKKLKPHVYYYFVKGFDIDDHQITCSDIRIEEELYNLILQGEANVEPNITYSAIVGENGSGKSTLVELYIRIINNLGASLLGEISIRQGMPHLHYIDGVYAEMYFFNKSDGQTLFFKIIVQGRNVEVLKFTLRADQGISKTFISDVTPIYNNGEPIEPGGKTISPFTRYLPPKGEPGVREILGQLAYSYISNFSIYAYNPYDFADEVTPSLYEKNCRKTGSIALKFTERHWLEGLFHRRESYQTPLVLYPARNQGNIDITKEKHLAYLRLISVILSEKSRFRKINDHLQISGISISGNNILYDIKYIRKHANYRFNSNGYTKLRKDIISLWDGIVGKPDGKTLYDFAKERLFGEYALGYLVYKTLKTSSTYPAYSKYFFSKYEKAVSAYDRMDLEKLISALAKDVSHVTRKIRQTLFYLVYGLYDVTQVGETIPIDLISQKCNVLLRHLPGSEEEQWKLCLRRFGIEDFTPPPFLSATLKITDIPSGKSVSFNSLSSGEKQFIYSITGIIYHLINLDSVEASSTQMAIYNNVNIILEEIELYFHPDLQRRLVKALSDGIRQCSFHHIKSINVLMVTHSPFILSDIPSRNVLALDKNGVPADSKEINIRTFGANIHDILKHPFFLKNGAMGEVSKKSIKYIAEQLDVARKEGMKKHESVNLARLIELIDEPILSKVLKDDYKSIFQNDIDEEDKLKQQIEELNARLKRIQDKN